MHIRLLIIVIFSSQILQAQTLGGNATYNFLKLSSSPLLTATGGVNISYRTNEVGFAITNPALLNKDVSSQLNASFNNFLGGIKAYSLSAGYHHQKLDATLGSDIFFVDYGSIPQTDAAGNVSGTFRPVDFVAQLSASKKYLHNWSYGISAKFIQSSYQQYKSAAMAFDVGVLYFDSLNNFSASIAAKNMGFQLSSYAGEREDPPFDLQVGITQKLAKAPFAFSVTAQHIHRFDITYNDGNFNDENDFASANTFTRIFNHFVIATHIYVGTNLEGTVGFNALRRNELSIASGGNGLTGFSAGLRIKFRKLQVLYARSQYQRNAGYNHFGITMHMDHMGGIGK